MLPKCPKCGGVALEMRKGETGWHYVQADGRGYHVGGKMLYVCVNGHEWEK